MRAPTIFTVLAASLTCCLGLLAATTTKPQKKAAAPPPHAPVSTHKPAVHSTAKHTVATRKPAASKTVASRSAASKNGKSVAHKAPVHATWRAGQAAPTPERYKQFQEALIAKGYLQGEATGQWDEASADAMRRFQRDQNLEPTGKPNQSLSIIALGLGPKY